VGGTVDWSSDPAPNLEYAREETKSVHQMDWGTSDDALRKYENNNGDVVKMEAEINDSADNPISFVPTDIDVEDLGAFPHSKSDVNATEAGEWSVDESGIGTSGASASVSNAETAPGVEAVRFSTTDLASGDVAKYTMSNFSITSDESKRYLVVGQDIATLDSGATVEYRVVDEDGDVDASVPYINIETMSPYQFGTQKADTDGDGDLEDKDITEKKTAGTYSLKGLETLGSAFENAVINSVTLDVIEEPDQQSDDNVFLNTTKTDKYPGYAGTATIAVRMEAEDAYDRSIANAVLRDTQSVTSERVLAIEYAEDVPADEAVDQGYLDNRTFNDMTGQYGSEGKEVQLDSSLSQGSPVLVKWKLKFTDSQMTALDNTMGGEGGSGNGAKGAGGLGSIPIIGGLLVALMGWLRRGE
jgi:hypothetical protein